MQLQPKSNGHYIIIILGVRDGTRKQETEGNPTERKERRETPSNVKARNVTLRIEYER